MNRFILITGDEDFLREKKKNELLSELGAPSSMNYNVFTGDELDIEELCRLAETLPFLEEYRKILLNDTGILRQSLSDDVIESISSIPESTVILFYEKEYDQSNALYKLIKKDGEILSFIKADSRKGKDKFSARNDIRKFVQDRLKSEKMSMDSDTITYFLELIGYEMMNADTELEKLICYKLADSNTSNQQSDKTVITKKDIDSICSRTISDRVFDMTGCMLSGRKKEAISILEDLYSLKVAPMKILYVMTKQFDQIYMLKELRENHTSDQGIATEMNIQDWLIKKLTDQSRSASKKDIRRYLEMCASLEQKVKQGDMPEKMAPEILIAY